jgi:hypothetical protein
MHALARIVGAAGCLLAALFAGALAWIGEEAQGRHAGEIAQRTGYAPAVFAHLEAGRLATPPSPPRPQDIAHLLKRAPLSDGALGLSGLAALAENRLELVDSRLRQAMRRNPRNAPARIWLADRALGSGDAASAILHLDSLIRLDGTRTDLWIDALVLVARLPGGLDALRRRLEAGEEPPAWSLALVGRLNSSPIDTDDLEPLNRLTPQAQASFVQRVLAEGGAAAAYRAWQGFVEGAAEAGPRAWPYDAGFEGRPGPAPFNWTLGSNLVEFAARGGLDISYLGRDRVPFAEQMILLPRGRYRFATRLSGESAPNGGGFTWEVSCTTPPGLLGQVEIRDLTYASKTFAFEFSVPASGCEAQVLRLLGLPGEFPTQARAAIASVEILPLDDEATR